MPRIRMHYREVRRRLRAMGDPTAVRQMARFGITAGKILGVSAPNLWKLSRQIGRDHLLSQKLWASGIHEARVLAATVDEPDKVTRSQMNAWTRDFDNWGVCDACCCVLFDKTPFAWDKAISWVGRKEEFVRRAGFVLMAGLAVHDKRTPDEQFTQFFPLIKRHATDERNFVKKAVNWALRQIGKRSPLLNRKAVAIAKEIGRIDSPAARWIAADALRELTSKKVQARLRAAI